jgi:hypothetical protein
MLLICKIDQLHNMLHLALESIDTYVFLHVERLNILKLRHFVFLAPSTYL